MTHKKTKSVIFTVLSLLIFSIPVLAHDDEDMEKKVDEKKEIKEVSPKAETPKIKDADHDMDHHDMVDKVKPDAHEMGEEEHEHHKNDKREFKRAFIEGTLNVISPYTYRKDSLYILYSHNFYTGSFPRGANPAFHFSYSPIKNFQLDTIFSLRYSPLEFEVGGKYVVLNEFDGAPISLAPRVSYNNRANVVGLDISASKIFFEDILQVGLGYRAIGYFGDPKIDDLTNKFAQGLGINAVYRFYKDWNLFGDVVVPFDSTLLNNHGFIWSAGIKKIIPHSPHILTLYAGNSNESTLTGRTISTGTNKYPDLLKVGFQFSIDIPKVSHFLETVL